MAGRWSQILVGEPLSRGSRLGFRKQEYRLVSRVYSRGGTFALEPSRERTITPEQRDSSPVHVNIEDFINDLKLEATPHDRRALKNIKNKLLNKYYKFHYIQI